MYAYRYVNAFLCQFSDYVMPPMLFFLVNRDHEYRDGRF